MSLVRTSPAPALHALGPTARVLALIVAIGGLTLVGCGVEAQPAATVIGPTPGGLSMRPCMHRDTIPAECGTLTVPERRDLAGSRLIAIPVIRIRALGATPGLPIFFLNGGPGGTNQRTRPPVWSRQNHDFVLVGFRGVDGSERLACPEFEQSLATSIRDLLSARAIADRRAATDRCARRLAVNGIDLAGYTMHEVVDDVDAARTALGVDRFLLYSESYGTRLAQIYAHRHRKHVERSVMVGVNPPGRFIWEAAQLDTVLLAYGRLCRQDTACRARTPDLAAAVSRVVRDMPTRWGPFPIHRGVVLLAAFQLLFSQQSAALALDAFIDADHGDASGLAALSLVAGYQLTQFDLVFGDMFAKGSADFDSVRGNPDAFDPPGSIMGSPMSSVFWTAVTASGGWPIVRPADHALVTPPSDVETLLIGGTLDVSTPAVYARQELLPQLSRGHQVIFRNAGHNDLWEFQGNAYAQLVGGFFDVGAIDTTGFSTQPITLHGTWTLALLAKLFVAGIMLALAILLFAGRKVVRRLRRS